MDNNIINGQNSVATSADVKSSIFKEAKEFGINYFSEFAEAYWSSEERPDLEFIIKTMDTDIDYQIVWRFIEDETEYDDDQLEEIIGEDYEWQIHCYIMEGATEERDATEPYVMSDIVGEYQYMIDGLIDQLKGIAQDFSQIRNADDAESALDIVREIDSLCDECLSECGKVSGCEMCPDDGYYPDLTTLGYWQSENPSEIREALYSYLYDYETNDRCEAV